MIVIIILQSYNFFYNPLMVEKKIVVILCFFSTKFITAPSFVSKIDIIAFRIKLFLLHKCLLFFLTLEREKGAFDP
jgi:hypothetical protein